MIAVAELLKKERLPGNYFAPSAYVQGDFELGLLENRQGNRLLALPSTLLEALYSGLEDEVGPAAGLVLFQCGKWWGKYFYRRFTEEVSAHYEMPLAEMEMVEFLQCIKQCWKTYGWGVLNLDFDHYEQGFVVATVENSAFAHVNQSAQASVKPICHTEAGLLSAFFSQLTGQELHCVQTTCESMGAAENTFILGLAERLQIAETAIEERQSHDFIMTQLGLEQSETPTATAVESTADADVPFSEVTDELLADATAPAEMSVGEAPSETGETTEGPLESVEELSPESKEALHNLAALSDLDNLDLSAL